MTPAEELALRKEKRKLKQAGLSDDPSQDNLPPRKEYVPDFIRNAEVPAENPETEDVHAELARLRADNQALRGRVAPSQREASDYKTLFEAEAAKTRALQAEADAKLADLRKQLDEATSAKKAQNIQDKINAILTDEDRDMVNPAVIDVMTKVFSNLVPEGSGRSTRDEIDAYLAEQRQQEVVAFRGSLMHAPSAKHFSADDGENHLSKLASLADDPEFAAYLEEKPEVNLTIDRIFKETDKDQIRKFAARANRMIGKFEERKTQPTGSADPRAARPAASHMRRTGEPSASIDLRKINEAKAMARSRNPEIRAQAEKILNSF